LTEFIAQFHCWHFDRGVSLFDNDFFGDNVRISHEAAMKEDREQGIVWALALATKGS